MKRISENLTALSFGVTFAIAMIYVLDINRERRFTLYHIRNELKQDISKTEVEEILNRHQTTFIKRIETENGINLMVHLGLADSISLVLDFSNEKLKTAILIGEDSPQDVHQDAPSNIE